MRELTFEDALKIAKGCLDYGGGYRDEEYCRIYHHGIETVISALTAASVRGFGDSQVRVLHAIGANAKDQVVGERDDKGTP